MSTLKEKKDLIRAKLPKNWKLYHIFFDHAGTRWRMYITLYNYIEDEKANLKTCCSGVSPSQTTVHINEAIKMINIIDKEYGDRIESIYDRYEELEAVLKNARKILFWSIF